MTWGCHSLSLPQCHSLAGPQRPRPQPGSCCPPSPLQAHSPAGYPISLRPPLFPPGPSRTVTLTQYSSSSHSAVLLINKGQNWWKGKPKMAGQGPGHLMHCPRQMGEQSLCSGVKGRLKGEKSNVFPYLLTHVTDTARSGRPTAWKVTCRFDAGGLNSVK